MPSFFFFFEWALGEQSSRVESVTVPRCVTRVRGLVLAFDFLGALLFVAVIVVE